MEREKAAKGKGSGPRPEGGEKLVREEMIGADDNTVRHYYEEKQDHLRCGHG